jgi:hypothetical protein
LVARAVAGRTSIVKDPLTFRRAPHFTVREDGVSLMEFQTSKIPIITDQKNLNRSARRAVLLPQRGNL